MKKIFIYAFCVVLLVFCSVFSVSAEWGEPLNYQDLDYEVQLGSDYNTVTVPLPSDNYYFSYWEDGECIDKQYGLTTFVIPGSIGDSYNIRVYPASTFGIVMDNIPDGSILRFDVRLTEYVSDNNGYVDYERPDVRLIGHYLVREDDKLKWKETQTVGRIYDSPLGGTYTCEFVIQPRDYEVFSFVPHIEFSNFVPLTESLFKIEIISSTLDMKISSDYWQQWQNEQNGEMLNTINDKLDNALNGEVEPDKSPVDDNVNDMLEKENELLQNTQEGRENVIKYITQAIAELSAYATAFVALNAILDGFFFLPIIGPLITVSLGLGIFALIVNLTQTLDRADRAKKSKTFKSSKGGK